MKKFYILSLVLILLLSIQSNFCFAQCDASTPVFNVNLTGNPSGTWTSTNISRDGFCCGSSGSDRCIEFIVTLDTGASGIRFDIASGAIPPGALYYQVNCGPPTQVGQFICLVGPGPHIITFCKPGNNINEYQITSAPKPSLEGTKWVSEACTGRLIAKGLVDTSITWTSIPNNPVYNSYLSCTADCDTVIVTAPNGPLPPAITYQVCGSILSGCAPLYFCDTIQVNFVTNLGVNILPKNPVICFGGGPAVVTANPAGGHAPYKYQWSTGATTQSVTVGVGTYTVQLTDSMNCSIASDTVVVTAVATQITANAGIDKVLCTNQQSIGLNGSVNTATGGQWSGGGGAFSPNDTTLNAIYTPTPAEVAAGNVHLTLVTTGNKGCPADTDAMVINISPSPAPAIGGNINTCHLNSYTYTTPFVSGHTYVWSATGGAVLTALNNTATVKWTTVGTGTLTVKETNIDGCDSTVTVKITINPKPAPVINGPSIVCTTTITAYLLATVNAGDLYSWNVTGGGAISGSSTGSSVNIKWSSAGNATVSVKVTNSLGCDSTISIPVTVLRMPTPVIIGPTGFCSGVTNTYSTPFVSGNTYSWSVTGGNVLATSANSITVKWPSSGSGLITLTEANTATCDSTVTLVVTIHPHPSPVISGPPAVCTTTTSNYSVSNPNGGDTYHWVVSGGTISGSPNAGTVNIQWNNQGNAMVFVTVTNSFGCDSTVNMPVTVLRMPAPVINGPTSSCEGQTFTYSSMAVPGNTYNWSVSGGLVLSTNNNNIVVRWLSSGNGSITLTESNTSACDSTVSMNITINPKPTPEIAGSAFACTFTTSQFVLVNSDPLNTYTWSVAGGTILGSNTSDNINVKWTNPGTGIITVREVNSFGCDSTVTFFVTIMSKPAPRINGDPAVCLFDTATYHVTPYVATDFYNWNVVGGSIIGFNVGDSIQVLWSIPGGGEVSVQQISPSGCDSAVKKMVMVNQNPSPSIFGPSSVCETKTATYNAGVINGDNYQWSVSEGKINGSSSSNSVNITMPNSGITTITLVETTPAGCSSSAETQITVPDRPSPAITGSGLGCIAQGVNTYTAPNIPGISYQWNITGGLVNSGNGSNSINVDWMTPGSHQVTLVATNAAGCDSTITISVLVDSLAKPMPIPDMSGCAPLNVHFTGNVMNAKYKYAWDFGDGYASTTTNPSHKFKDAGTYPITLLVTNNTGCKDTVSAVAEVYPSPAADFNLFYSPEIYYAGLSELSLKNLSGGASKYLWNFGNGDTSNLFEPIYNYTVPGKYNITLTATNQYGCSDIARRLLDVKLPEDLYIPNAFTPNGDAKNNTFFVATKNITQLHIDIFNRWGEHIFSSDDPYFQWDGLYMGRPVQQGVYVYLLRATGIEGTSFLKEGTVTVLR